MSEPMNKEDYLRNAVSQIENKADRLAVERELSSHIEERTKYYQEIGYDAETAAQKAVEQMGEAELVAPAFSKLHPKGRVWTAVLAVLWLLFWIFNFWVFVLVSTDNGEIVSIGEIPMWICCIWFSRFGKKRLNRFLCGLPMVMFLLTFVEYFRIENDVLGHILCSGFIMKVACMVTGDLACLNVFPLVGRVTVAPWLTVTTIVWYIFIFLLLVAEFVSVCRLHQPPYSLFDKKASKVISIVQKTVCIGLAVVTVLPWCPLFDVPIEFPKDTNYNTVVIAQSDVPCSIEEIPAEDILILDVDYNWGVYILSWDADRDTNLAYDSTGESLRFNCGNKLQYGVQKTIILPQITKEYVYITALDSYASSDADIRGSVYLHNLTEFVTVSAEDWQKTELVDAVNFDIDQYNCVEIIVNEPA